ncbi:putative transcription initiation factor IIF, alpha subunit [Rosa chinensis]|uniref:Transcription initiation factor IIF subunit alpha n=1 Tax=Rosa chinensis TaxID=74649 RepID=A0A2P6PVG8_ROSCH|nr:putative transcription initiation factor IIF, alpha subunit [Rosa chinensis]
MVFGPILLMTRSTSLVHSRRGCQNFGRKVVKIYGLNVKRSKDGLQGRQDNFQDKLLRNKLSWRMKIGSLYQGDPEELSAAYYLLMLEGKEISAIPAGSWYVVYSVAQYKQFTLEEAEDKMNSRKKKQYEHERWIMKAATNGAVAYGNVEKFGDSDSKHETGDDDDDERNFSDKGDGDEKGGRKNRCRRNDENSPEEIEDFATEVPAPPKLKQIIDHISYDDEDYSDDEDGRLSKSGNELKKVLGRLNKSDTEDDNDDDNDNADGDDNLSYLLWGCLILAYCCLVRTALHKWYQYILASSAFRKVRCIYVDKLPTWYMYQLVFHCFALYCITSLYSLRFS